LDAEDALREPKQRKDIPDGWDFPIRASAAERLETIARPDVVLRSDYFKPLDEFVIPYPYLPHLLLTGLPNDCKDRGLPVLLRPG
jgi:hypothetical protein